MHGNNFENYASSWDSEWVFERVADQFGKPTSASELARVCLETLRNKNLANGAPHLAQPEITNWHEFSKVIR